MPYVRYSLEFLASKSLDFKLSFSPVQLFLESQITIVKL